MAGNFRLSFNDIDTSQALGVVDSFIRGYMVLKAPKGNALPTYFPRGSANKIISLIGVPSVTYPNIQDALDFNAQYGLYISSPASGSLGYASYYGGVYLTEYGLFNFDRVSDITSPNYKVALTIGGEVAKNGLASVNSNLSWNSGSGIIIGDGEGSAYIPDWVYDKLSGIRLTYNGNNLGSEDLKGKVIDITVDKSANPAKLKYEGTEIGNITTTNGTHIATLAGTLDTSPTSPEILWGEDSLTIAYFTSYFNSNGITKEWILDLADDTYFYLNQRSPSEIPTNLTISKIGYFRSISSISTSDASTCVFTCKNHSLTNLSTISFSQIGSLSILGHTATRKYYVHYINADTFSISILPTSTPLVYESTPGTPTSSQIIGTIGAGVTYTETKWSTNQISFSFTEAGAPGKQVVGGTFIGNLVSTSKDSYNSNNYIENLLMDTDNNFLQIRVVKPFTGSTLYSVPAATTVSITGKRYAAQADADLAVILSEGWEFATEDEYDVVDLFMEPSGEPSIKDSLVSLRSVHQLSTIIAPILGTTVDEIHDAHAGAPSSKGLAYYANQFMIKENYAGTQFWSNCIGAIGTKLATIMLARYGGWAPMFVDYNGLGGSLPVSVIKQKVKFSNENQQLMDQLGINVIIQDPYHGPLILGQKTSIATGEISDWSYLAHSMAFDSFKREIRDLVMIPQLGKPIDTEFQNLRQFQAQAILDKRTLGPNRIWEAGIVDAYVGNDAAAKAARTFKLLVRVKVTVFSEFVELTLENVGQNVTL